MHLSYSSLETYRTCPLKFKYQNIDHIKTPKSPEAVFGTLIHSTMKYIHTPVLLPPTLEQALNHFSSGWNSEIYKEEVEERAAFSQGIQIIQKYYDHTDITKPLIVDLESRFSLPIITPDGTRHTIAGSIDRIDKTDDGYEIIDYKTAKKMPSQEKVDTDLQLTIYLLAFLQRYPKEIINLDKITVSLYFLKHGVKLSAKRTQKQLDEVGDLFFTIIALINSGTFEARINPLCDWCGYQNICPMWRHKFKKTQKIERGTAEASFSDYITLKKKMTEDRIRIGKLQKVIIDYMKQEDVGRVFTDGYIIGKSKRQTFTYDKNKIRAILEPIDRWEEVLKIDNITLNRIMQSLPLPLQNDINTTAKKLSRESETLVVKRGDGLEK